MGKIRRYLEEHEQDEELRQEMIRKGYERMAKWTAEEFGDRLMKIINKL